jgi:hypothetical protein
MNVATPNISAHKGRKHNETANWDHTCVIINASGRRISACLRSPPAENMARFVMDVYERRAR